MKDNKFQKEEKRIQLTSLELLGTGKIEGKPIYTYQLTCNEFIPDISKLKCYLMHDKNA